jgi:hypothetical protein
MNATKFLHYAKHALVPMRKATVDAILFTFLIVWILAFTGVIFSYPWLIIVVYALVQFFALVLRLRQAERQLKLAAENEEASKEASQELSAAMRKLAWIMLYWGKLPYGF